MTAQQILDQEAQKILDQILAKVRNAMSQSHCYIYECDRSLGGINPAIKSKLVAMGFEIKDSLELRTANSRNPYGFIIYWDHLTPNLTPKPLIAEWD